MDCDVAKDCDIGRGYYDLIGLFRVLGPASFELDVRAIEAVPPPGLPPPPRQLEAPCHPKEGVAPLRGWSKHFGVEQGGAVALVKGDIATEIGYLTLSYGVTHVEMETCEGVLAVWMPSLDCPPHSGLMQLFEATRMARSASWTDCYARMPSITSLTPLTAKRRQDPRSIRQIALGGPAAFYAAAFSPEDLEARFSKATAETFPTYEWHHAPYTPRRKRRAGRRR